MFTLRSVLQDKNPGMSYGGRYTESTRDRRLDRELSTMSSLSHPIRSLSSVSDVNRIFTFSKRVGITSPQSVALSNELDKLVTGKTYRGTKAIVRCVSKKIHRNIASKTIAITYRITLEASQSVLADIAYLDFDLSPTDFHILCPSYTELDERKRVYTLSLALEPNEISQLTNKIQNTLQSVSDFHELSVQFLPSPWYRRTWLSLFRQKELRVRFEGKSLNIKSILHAIDIDSPKIRRFTHEYQTTL